MDETIALLSREDKTRYARIRDAALQLFAAKGAQATSMRDIASAAGVSIGLVQHHFGTKSDVRDAIDTYVTGIVADAIEYADSAGSTAGARSTDSAGIMRDLVADQPIPMTYLARAVADRHSAALSTFDDLVAAFGVSTTAQGLAGALFGHAVERHETKRHAAIRRATQGRD